MLGKKKEVVEETKFDSTLDDAVEEFKERTNDRLGGGVTNRSITSTIMKEAKREASYLQHKCRLEEDYDLVGEIRSYMKSLRTLEYGLRGNRF